MARRLIGVTTAGLLMLSLCGIGRAEQHPVHVSVIQLIAAPEKFDGKLVSTSGFLSIERESTLLYLDEDSYRNRLTDNAIWFFLSEDMGKEREKINHNYVSLIGIFRNQKKGAGTNPNGGIDPVQRYGLISVTSSLAQSTESSILAHNSYHTQNINFSDALLPACRQESS